MKVRDRQLPELHGWSSLTKGRAERTEAALDRLPRQGPLPSLPPPARGSPPLPGLIDFEFTRCVGY